MEIEIVLKHSEYSQINEEVFIFLTEFIDKSSEPLTNISKDRIQGNFI